ncbi:MAG: hypothetical protein AAGC74_02510 [Verrucomicrobiota bacterium]
MGGGVLALLVVGLKLVVGALLSEAFLVSLFEENLNCRAKVDSVRVSLLGRELRAEGVQILPKGGADGVSELGVEEVRVGLKILPVLQKRIEARRLVLVGLQVKMGIDEEGRVSLEDWFGVPSGETRSEAGGKEGREVAVAKQQEWLARLEETRIEGGEVAILLEEHGLEIGVADLEVRVEELEFDPERLESLNEVKLDLAGRAGVANERGRELLLLDLAGRAEGELFDEETGDFDLALEADFLLGDDSYVSPRIEWVERVWGLAARARVAGFGLGELPAEIGFGSQRRIHGRYGEGKVELVEGVSLDAGPWELGVARDSWIETYSGEHVLGVEFFAGERVSGLLEGWLGKLPREARELVRERFVEEKRVLWRVESRGRLKEPQLDFLPQIPEAGDLMEDLEGQFGDELKKLREEGKGLLRGLFDSL